MPRTPSIDVLVPALYLKVISTGDMQEVLEAILGKDAKGLSSTNIVRLKEIWESEYSEWSKRDLSLSIMCISGQMESILTSVYLTRGLAY